ncbi:MAG: M28 family peptidase [Bacteroidia bacterium]
MRFKYIYLAMSLLLLAANCKNEGSQQVDTDNKQTQQPPVETITAPAFNADSAYYFVEKQVSFGPRVPGTKEHAKCADFLFNTLKNYTPNVEMQKGQMAGYDGKMVPIKNIIAKFGPDSTNRILLCAHWDTRAWADQDKDSSKRKTPVLGANDGASGVGVLLEMARQFSIKAPNIGVTILLVDAEDQGTPEFVQNPVNGQNSYCLGTQYWAKNLDKTKYTADYGIVLDMVGGRFARFLQEEISVKFAGNQVHKVWTRAAQLGFSGYFIFNQTGPITDDHYYINTMAQIPCLDIIDYDGSREKGFGHYWHTQNDNMGIIDRATLDAVGKTVLSVIYTEKVQSL